MEKISIVVDVQRKIFKTGEDQKMFILEVTQANPNLNPKLNPTVRVGVNSKPNPRVKLKVSVRVSMGSLLEKIFFCLQQF